ncbi:hypothetical protein ACQKFK_31885 [Bacillus mycoides]|uniref:hypothetical protein n=1 Tax=Bacillus mycoides TaxID=1405 RepID=UPI003D01E0F4
MGVTLEELEKCFNEAVNEEAEYVAVQIEMVGFPSDEVMVLVQKIYKTWTY